MLESIVEIQARIYQLHGALPESLTSPAPVVAAKLLSAQNPNFLARYSPATLRFYEIWHNEPAVPFVLFTWAGLSIGAIALWYGLRHGIPWLKQKNINKEDYSLKR